MFFTAATAIAICQARQLGRARVRWKKSSTTPSEKVAVVSIGHLEPHVPDDAVIVKDREYTTFPMSANVGGALSQAHKENRVYRSGKPVGAIFIGGAS